MMEQVRQINESIQPDYTFLVIDAMTGQDAVGVAEAFHETLAIDGVILSKLDGDARGGAALSVKEVIGRPIAFASTGEKLDAFEQFHPDRMAGRILGMGDVLTLIEQAEQAFEKDSAEEAAERMLAGEFTLDDFLEQMQQLKKMGPLSGLLGMMPGMPKELKGAKIDDDDLKPVEAIIRSMTPLERRKPEIINGSRRNRIAAGSGTSVGEINRLVKQFSEMQKMMKRMGGMAMGGKKGKRKMPPMLGAAKGGLGGGMGGLPPGFPDMPFNKWSPARPGCRQRQSAVDAVHWLARRRPATIERRHGGRRPGNSCQRARVVVRQRDRHRSLRRRCTRRAPSALRCVRSASAPDRGRQRRAGHPRCARAGPTSERECSRRSTTSGAHSGRIAANHTLSVGRNSALPSTTAAPANATRAVVKSASSAFT